MRSLLLLLCAAHFVRFWILPGFDSLWIDETGTFWTIADGWRQLWARTGMHPNSRLYGAIVLAWTHVAGSSEFALRLPSLAAMLATVATVALFLRRQLGPGAALPVAALCLASPVLSYYGLDARPYSFALLLFVLSAVAWFHLTGGITWRWATLWAVSSGLVVHFHPVVAFALGGQFVWLLPRAGRSPLSLRRALPWCALFAAAALVALPEVLRVYPLLFGENISAIPGRASAIAAARASFPVSVYGPAALALAAIVLTRQWRPAPLHDATRRLALYGAVLLFSNLAVCLLYALVKNHNIMLTRYVLAIYPLSLLLIATLLTGWTTARGQLIFSLVFSGSTLAFSGAAQGWVPRHADADWRSALAAVRQWEDGHPRPLILQTGFIEGMRAWVLGDPKWQPFLYAPALYYRHNGPTYAAPFRFDDVRMPHWQDSIERVHGQQFAAIVYHLPSGTPPGISAMAARHGEPKLLARFRRLDVYVFQDP